ncbi:Uma2 family endonuclease [Nocardia sp. NPDC048505]|uniref:Uma2 family endonuclease n=1 Tax=Nocardia sp. NPDC048505 TaxID=3155756 RepID=UPI0033DCB438
MSWDPNEVAETLARLQREGVLPESRIESMGDQIVMLAAARWEHNEIQQQIVGHVRAHGLMGLTTQDVVLPDGREPIPDVTVLDGPPAPGSKPIAGETLLLVEIVSESNWRSDYMGKLERYAWAGVPEYLLVDPRDKLIFRYQRPDRQARRWHGKEDFAFGDDIPLLCLPDHPLGTADWPSYA